MDAIKGFFGALDTLSGLVLLGLACYWCSEQQGWTLELVAIWLAVPVAAAIIIKLVVVWLRYWWTH